MGDCWYQSAVLNFLTHKKKAIKDDLLMPDSRTPTLHDLKVAIQYLLTAKGALSTKNYASDILHCLKSHCPSPDDHWVHVEDLKQLFIAENNLNDSATSIEETESSDWRCFEEMLNNADLIGLTPNLSSAHYDISFRKIQMWMEMAQKSCVFVANAVSSETELVDCLNTIMSGVIIVITFVIWLLLTKLATSKLLVLIASPLLAATFIFGDTCKNLFHSIIFVYVLHPFDVGHLCDIDVDQNMEVKSVGVWKTTFL